LLNKGVEREGDDLKMAKKESKDGVGSFWVKVTMLAFCDSGFASESSL
jgi:hypothetical protein